jgi:hypothetical protein
LIRATLVGVILLAAVAADEGIDTPTSNAWWIPAFLAVWVGSNAIGSSVARVLPPVRESLAVWRYRVAFDLEPTDDTMI